MRDRLLKLCKKSHSEWLEKTYDHETDKNLGEYVADYLLENGVIVPPCKVGDKVYEIEYEIGSYEMWEAHPLETEVKAICLLTENDYHPLDRIGKDVFLTKNEAEQALKGGAE
jgi:hypothetical protein